MVCWKTKQVVEASSEKFGLRGRSLALVSGFGRCMKVPSKGYEKRLGTWK